MGLVPEKQLKKVLTPEPKFSITTEGSKRDKGLLPGRVFVFSDPSHKKNNPNTTGKEKEHIHVFIESS
jgi:hypothetical protein